MGFLKKISDLKESIIHDTSSLERYGKETENNLKFSVLVFKNRSEMQSSMLADILHRASRKSDLVFNDGDIFVLLMPATDRTGAKFTFHEIHEICKKLDGIETLVYPDDSFDPDTFYNKVHNFISKLK